MQIKLAGWSSVGLRCPDMTVDLRDASGAPPKVALIQMPNGTGKTTTLELLNAALNGEAATWVDSKVRSFRRRGDVNPRGSFLARLLVDGRPMTIELSLDFESGQASYRTTNPGSGGIVPLWSPLPDVKRFLKPQFLKLFIFDGEFAERLFNSEAAEADRAIDALCQIYLLDDVAQFAREAWERKVNQGGPMTAASLKRFKDRRVKLLARRADAEAAKRKAEQTILTAAAAISELEKRITERLNSVESTRKQNVAAQVALAEARTSVERISTEVMQAIRTPLAIHEHFATALIDLRDNLDVLRLPENTSAQFFQDLVKETECVCGREMTEGAKTEIGTRAKQYLDADESGTINALKQDISRFTAPGEEAPHLRLAGLLDGLGLAHRANKSAEQAVRTLEQKLIDEGDEELKVWQQSLKEHRDAHQRCLAILAEADQEEETDQTGDELLLSIKAIDKRLRETDRKISELTSTVSLRVQTETIKAILDQAAVLARAMIKDELLVEANRRLETVLVNDPLKLSKVDRSLRLEGQDSASVGQILAVGYTFLMTILERGNNDFPLIVDSPANSIDETVRRNIGTLIPKLCSQFVAFTINTERNGFVPALEKAEPGIRFLTMFRKTAGTKRLMVDLPKDGVIQTDTGVLVADRTYFMNFDVAKEAE